MWQALSPLLVHERYAAKAAFDMLPLTRSFDAQPLITHPDGRLKNSGCPCWRSRCR
jgi:hypothetical protein